MADEEVRVGRGGVQIGYRTVLVLSGSTSRGDTASCAFQPDRAIDSIADMCDAELLEMEFAA